MNDIDVAMMLEIKAMIGFGISIKFDNVSRAMAEKKLAEKCVAHFGVFVLFIFLFLSLF